MRAEVDAHRRLVLNAWEAISSERDLRSVLLAVADVIKASVAVDGIGIVIFEAGAPRLYELHLSDARFEESAAAAFLSSASEPPRGLPDRPILAYGPELWARFREGSAYGCDNLAAKKGWYPHESKLVESGVLAYLSAPLMVRGELIGVSVFNRVEAEGFSAEQTALLCDVSRALAVAAANALANEEIVMLRDRLEAENCTLRAQLNQASPAEEEILGRSPELLRMLEAVDQVAPTDSTVLVTGETGTGKELIARAIHRRSRRSEGPFIALHCASIPETLLASELFGHERGAFTGAVQRQPGRFEQAAGGTLFLDEVGEMPAEAQVSLLRVLQEREVQRLGGSRAVPVDVRVIAATHRDLAAQVRAGRFREDLYYRLNVFPIHAPPLRRRRGDIATLASAIAAKASARMGKAMRAIDERSLKRLESYSWPGNVRELENVLERAVILMRDGVVRVERDALQGLSPSRDLSSELQDRESESIEWALRQARGRVAGPKGAARLLGMAPSTLEFRIKKLGIDKLDFRRLSRE
jgi:formate hydrogenlyase transcriptional activator